MKTKIIYISGNEVFDMADIRAAFEEVRSTLGLGKDTVMFGVPVDSDDALAAENTKTAQDDVVLDSVINQPEPVAESISATVVAQEAPVAEVIAETVDTPSVEEEPAPRNIKKSTTRKSRSHTKEKAAEAVAETTEQKSDDTEKIIPILSILAAKKEDSAEAEPAPQVIEPEVVEEVSDTPATDEEENVETVETTSISDIDISADITDDVKSDEEHRAAIADMITDDAPEAPVEKTLEQLLESMTPLREDITEDIEDEVVPDEDVVPAETDSALSDDDTDATLEQLAAEFAENQDKIPVQPKAESHSKIGKLKNILPFKKAKRDDSGLMGDLFGWAGIAANDDDFAIPGFFTNAASKK